MPTTIHVPANLLRKIDGRARKLGLSRNRFIVQTLADKVDVPLQWPDEFVRELRRPVSADVAAAASAMQQLIDTSRRSRKRPPRL